MLVNYSDSEEEEETTIKKQIPPEKEEGDEKNEEENDHEKDIEEEEKTEITTQSSSILPPLPEFIESNQAPHSTTIPTFLKTAKFGTKKPGFKRPAPKSKEEENPAKKSNIETPSYPDIDFSAVHNEEVEDSLEEKMLKKKAETVQQKEQLTSKDKKKKDKRKAKNLLKKIDPNAPKNRGNMGSGWRTESPTGRWKSKGEMMLRQQYD